jgi:hypothetical protein
MKKLLIAAMTLALTASAADAAHKPKHKVRAVRLHAVAVPVVPPDPWAAYYLPTPRPPWAAPWQCFTDEGYGRFRPCDAGPSAPTR